MKCTFLTGLICFNGFQDFESFILNMHSMLNVLGQFIPCCLES